MFPDQNRPQPQPQAHPSFTPHAPQRPDMHYADFAHGSVQQNQNGQYEVVPPVNNNSGASGHNPYEFIVAPNMPKRGFSLGGGSFIKQIALFGAAAVLVVVILAVVFSMLGPKDNTPNVIAVIQRQQEITRIATTATKQITSANAGNLVGDINIAVSSSQQQLVGYLASKGTKLSAKTLALDKSTQTDSLLANAASAGNYDSTVVDTLTTQLQTYESLMKTAYSQSRSTTVKKLLKQSFTDTQALLAESKDVQTAQ